MLQVYSYESWSRCNRSMVTLCYRPDAAYFTFVNDNWWRVVRDGDLVAERGNMRYVHWAFQNPGYVGTEDFFDGYYDPNYYYDGGGYGAGKSWYGLWRKGYDREWSRSPSGSQEFGTFGWFSSYYEHQASRSCVQHMNQRFEPGRFDDGKSVSERKPGCDLKVEHKQACAATPGCFVDNMPPMPDSRSRFQNRRSEGPCGEQCAEEDDMSLENRDSNFVGVDAFIDPTVIGMDPEFGQCPPTEVCASARSGQYVDNQNRITDCAALPSEYLKYDFYGASSAEEGCENVHVTTASHYCKGTRTETGLPDCLNRDGNGGVVLVETGWYSSICMNEKFVCEYNALPGANWGFTTPSTSGNATGCEVTWAMAATFRVGGGAAGRRQLMIAEERELDSLDEDEHDDYASKKAAATTSRKTAGPRSTELKTPAAPDVAGKINAAGTETAVVEFIESARLRNPLLPRNVSSPEEPSAENKRRLQNYDLPTHRPVPDDSHICRPPCWQGHISEKDGSFPNKYRDLPMQSQAYFFGYQPQCMRSLQGQINFGEVYAWWWQALRWLDKPADFKDMGS